MQDSTRTVQMVLLFRPDADSEPYSPPVDAILDRQLAENPGYAQHPLRGANRRREIVTSPGFESYDSCMTTEEARQIIVEGINYAAYRETDSSLYDSDKNRLIGSEHYNSGRHVVKPSPWSEGDFEEKMAMLLRWANALNASVPTFAQAQTLLEAEDSIMGRVIRLSKGSQTR